MSCWEYPTFLMVGFSYKVWRDGNRHRHATCYIQRGGTFSGAVAPEKLPWEPPQLNGSTLRYLRRTVLVVCQF
jgi:hypothetical protein